MEAADYVMIAVGLALFGSQWILHRDMAALRERMAKVETAIELLTQAVLPSRPTEP